MQISLILVKTFVFHKNNGITVLRRVCIVNFHTFTKSIPTQADYPGGLELKKALKNEGLNY